MSWTDEIYFETHNLWLKYKETCKLDAGYAIFYSPMKDTSSMTIIGINPGGSKDSFNPTMKPPEWHEYTEDGYDMAVVMNNLFLDTRLYKAFESSVKFNLNFFRTRDEDQLKELQCFKELNKYCYQKSKLILEKLKPHIIICEGIGTYDKVRGMIKEPFLEDKVLISDSRGRVMCQTQYEDVTIIGIVHPTGSHTKNRFKAHIDQIKEELNNHG